MDNYMTRLVTEELENLNQYLSTQPADLHVSIDSAIPADRYLVPESLALIVQHAQHYNLYPLHISISFLKYTVEISYPLQPRPVPDESFPDIKKLVDKYSLYFNLPTIRQTSDKIEISIPLFI